MTMEKQFAVLQKTEQDGIITQETHPGFLCLLQRAVLLGLQEQGHLGIPEYRRAEEALNRQYRSCIKENMP
jgi:hypothetical protein